MPEAREVAGNLALEQRQNSGYVRSLAAWLPGGLRQQFGPWPCARELGTPCTPPQTQPVGDHLCAPVVWADGVELEISDEDVEGNRRLCFSADPDGRSLQRASTCAQDA